MTLTAKVLIVDDLEEIRWLLSKLLRREGMETEEAGDGETAVRLISLESPDVVLMDIRMPGMNGLEVLKQARKLDGDLPIIMITAFAGVQGAVEAMKAGAYDYLVKPFDNREVIQCIRQALTARQRKRQVRHLEDATEQGGSLRDLMGESELIHRLDAEVVRVAPTDFSVVLTGETGAGKDVVARAIHARSVRSSGPFLAVDCGAIPDSLIESDLFGHEKGAFTGADRIRIGKFEAASGGTLFLDEISNLPVGMQSKLLRVLQEKRVYRIGSTAGVKVDVRVIAATNRDLWSLVGEKTFREDVFHRLSEYAIDVPPLRERREDIVFLAKRFLDWTNWELTKTVRGFSQSAMDRMLAYAWPGNVRELRNVVRRATLLAEEVIHIEHLGHEVDPGQREKPSNIDLGKTLPESLLSLKAIVHRTTMQVEREVLTQVLRKTGGNKAAAARLLHIDYKTIHSKLRQYEIQLPSRFENKV